MTPRSRVSSNIRNFLKGSPPIALSTPASLAPFKLPLKSPSVPKHIHGSDKHNETYTTSKASTNHNHSATRHLNFSLNHISNPTSQSTPELHSNIESPARNKRVGNCNSLNNLRTKECIPSLEKVSPLDESISLKDFNSESDEELEMLLADSFDTSTQLQSNANINTSKTKEVTMQFEGPDMSQNQHYGITWNK